MTRKDTEKDSDRPHYYSQFWLDVAAGRRVIGAPKPNEEAESTETEAAEPILSRKAGRDQEEVDFDRASTDGRAEAVIHPVAEPIAPPEEFIEPEAEDLDVIGNDEEELDLPDSDIPDVDLEATDEAEEEGEDEFYDEEEEEEEEEEDEVGWSGPRGRKKPKPVRPKILPKKPRRETRRGF